MATSDGDGYTAFVDLLMNRALACDRARNLELANAHLEIAMKVLHSLGIINDEPPPHIDCHCFDEME